MLKSEIGDATEDDEQVCGIACERGGSDSHAAMPYYLNPILYNLCECVYLNDCVATARTVEE